MFSQHVLMNTSFRLRASSAAAKRQVAMQSQITFCDLQSVRFAIFNFAVLQMQHDATCSRNLQSLQEGEGTLTWPACD